MGMGPAISTLLTTISAQTLNCRKARPLPISAIGRNQRNPSALSVNYGKRQAFGGGVAFTEGVSRVNSTGSAGAYAHYSTLWGNYPLLLLWQPSGHGGITNRFRRCFWCVHRANELIQAPTNR